MARPDSPAHAGNTTRFTRNWGAYLFLAPALLILFLSLLLPAVSTLVMSLTDISFLRPTNFVGLENYFHQARMAVGEFTGPLVF